MFDKQTIFIWSNIFSFWSNIFSFFSCPSLCTSFLIFFLSSYLIGSKSLSCLVLSCLVFFSQHSLFFLLFSSLCSTFPFLLPFCLFSIFFCFLLFISLLLYILLILLLHFCYLILSYLSCSAWNHTTSTYLMLSRFISTNIRFISSSFPLPFPLPLLLSLTHLISLSLHLAL